MRGIVVAGANRDPGDVAGERSRVGARELEVAVRVQLDVGPIVGAYEVNPLPQRSLPTDRGVRIAARRVDEPAVFAVLEPEIEVLVEGRAELARNDGDAARTGWLRDRPTPPR